MMIGARPHAYGVLSFFFVVTSADVLCCVWFIYPVLFWYWGPEVRTISFGHFSSLKKKAKSSLRKVVLNKRSMIANVKNANYCINI
jgi:hypothetical protein